MLMVVCAANIWQTWNSEVKMLPKKNSVEKDSGPVNLPSKRAVRIPPESKFNSVTENNLFSSERGQVLAGEEAETVFEEVKISGRKIVLFGVIIADDYKIALINNPDRRSADKKSRWVKEGERLGNLEITHIDQQEISLNDGNNNYKISLYDPDKAKKKASGYQESEQPKVVSVGDEANKKIRKSPKKTEKINPSKEVQYEYIDTPFGKVKRKKK